MKPGNLFLRQRLKDQEPLMPKYGSERTIPALSSTLVYHPSRIKETLRKRFAELANDFEKRLHTISVELTSVDGSLEVTTGLIALF